MRNPASTPPVARHAYTVQNRRMVEVDKSKALEVFQLLDDGKSPYRIEEAGIISLRSAQRLKAVKEGQQTGRSVEELCRATGWAEARVARILEWLAEFQVTQYLPVHAEPDVSNHPMATDALTVHFSHVRSVADRLWRYLGDVEEDFISYGGPTIAVRYDRSGGVGVNVWISQDEDPLRLDALESHAESHAGLWKAYYEFKARLINQVAIVIENPSKAIAWPSEVAHFGYLEDKGLVPKKGRVLIEKPGEFRDLIKELQLFVFTGTVHGSCGLCPNSK